MIDYKQYINSNEWREIARQRMELDDHTCCVCGRPATQVHHLTYEHLGNEPMDDLVSLCHRCHMKAEDLYDPSLTPWGMEAPEANGFIAAMRIDAETIAPMVFDYLLEVRGSDFDALMTLRQPNGGEYWGTLAKAVNALCRKRYSKNCAEDRMSMMMGALTNHVESICLAHIEHYVRNSVQGALHDIVLDEYAALGKWKAVAEKLDVSTSVVRKLKSDDGKSFGPTLREAVLYHCGVDALAGVPPIEGFSCLTEEDYELLNHIATYVRRPENA